MLLILYRNKYSCSSHHYKMVIDEMILSYINNISRLILKKIEPFKTVVRHLKYNI